MTRILACLALFLLLIPFSPKRDSPKPVNNSQFISLTPILLNSEYPGKQDIGDLKFVSGWELHSKNNNFGGISALLAFPKNRFIGLSDSGVLIGFTLANELQTKRPFIAPLPGGPGERGKKADRDSEAMAYDPSTGRFWVSFEQEHSVWRYSRSFARAEISHAHPAMQKWPSNGGAEAMARLTNGKFIVISEGGDGPDGSYAAILFHGDPAEERTRSDLFGYQPPKGFRITDMAQLPDGRLLLLNRKFSFFDGLAAKITPNGV